MNDSPSEKFLAPGFLVKSKKELEHTTPEDIVSIEPAIVEIEKYTNNESLNSGNARVALALSKKYAAGYQAIFGKKDSDAADSAELN